MFVNLKIGNGKSKNLIGTLGTFAAELRSTESNADTLVGARGGCTGTHIHRPLAALPHTVIRASAHKPDSPQAWHTRSAVQAGAALALVIHQPTRFT